MPVKELEVIAQCTGCNLEIPGKAVVALRSGAVYGNSSIIDTVLKHAEEFGPEHETFKIRGKGIEPDSSQLVLTSIVENRKSRDGFYVGSIWVE